jgi:hypothetical protein
VTEGWRKLYNLDSSPNIIGLVKSRTIIWEGHVAHMGEKRYSYRVSREKPEGKIH